MKTCVGFVILSEAKYLTHEAWITLPPNNVPQVCARFLAPLGMTAKKPDTEIKKKSAKEVYTLTDLQAWHDLNPPVRLGVFGDPVEHSLSPQMQNAALKHFNI